MQSFVEVVPPSPDKFPRHGTGKDTGTAAAPSSRQHSWTVGSSPAAQRGAATVVREAYGGDSYGTLASKRGYVEIDYLREESERKRAKLLTVPSRPSAAALLLQESDGDSLALRLHVVTDYVQPEEAVLPTCSIASDAALKHPVGDHLLRRLLMPVPCRRATVSAASMHKLGLQQMLETTSQLRQPCYRELEWPSVRGLDELIGPDAGEELLVQLPVPDCDRPPVTIHTAMAKGIKEAFASCTRNATPLAELPSNTANKGVDSLQLRPIEVPATIGIDIAFLRPGDEADLQEIMQTSAPETVTIHRELSSSLDTQQIQQAVSVLVSSASKAPKVPVIGLDTAELAATRTKQISLLELPCVAQLEEVHAEQPLVDVLRVRAVQNLILPVQANMPRAPALFRDTLHKLCSDGLKMVLACSKHRLYLQHIPLPVLVSPCADVATEFLAQASSLVPCSTHSLELKLKPRRVDASPSDIGFGLIAQDLQQLIEKNSRQSDRAAFPISVVLQTLGSAPMKANTHDASHPTVTDPLASELRKDISPEQVHCVASGGDVQLPSTATGSADPVRPPHITALETPMAPRVHRTQYKQQSEPSRDHAKDTEPPVDIPVLSVRAGKAVLRDQSFHGQTLRDIARWQNETGLIPAELLSELIGSSSSGSAWGNFRSAFDFSTCDTRGAYFQYCSMVDELLDEAAEQCPRMEALLKPDPSPGLSAAESRATSSSWEPPTPSMQSTSAIGMKVRGRGSAALASQAAESTTQVAKKRKLKQNCARLQPSNLKEFIAEATGADVLPKRSGIAAPEGVPVGKLQISMGSIITSGQSSLVLLPVLVEKALHAICMYNYATLREDRAVLWLSEDTAALVELHVLMQSFCEISAAGKRDIQCQLISHHADVRNAVKDCAILMMTPSVLDRAMRHDASLPRLLAASTDVLALQGLATAHVVATKYSRLFAPWLAEPRGSKGKTAVVFATGALPQSIEEFSTVLQRLRLDRIVGRLSTDPDIAAMLGLKQAASREVKFHPSVPALQTLKTHIGSLMRKLELSDIQQAAPSSQSLILLANEAGQNVRTAHSIGDTSAKDSWSEKYRVLLQTLVCLQTFETMADSTAEAGLGVLRTAIADMQGKGRILKGALNGLYEELQQSVAEMTNASSMTKLATLQAVLSEEHRSMNQSDNLKARTSPSQAGLKVLVVVADDVAAEQVVAGVQSNYPTELLHGTSSDCMMAAASSDAHVYVAQTSSLQPSPVELWQSFSIVITACEPVDIICDPTLQQHVHAQRLRHIAILVEPSDSAQRTTLHEPSRLDRFVSAARTCAGLPAVSMEAIDIDSQFCKRLADSTEFTAAIRKAAVEMSRRTNCQPQQQSRTQREGGQEQPTVIVSNGVLRRNDILRHLETNGVNVVERENSMTAMDMIITPSTGCVMLTLTNVQACTGDQPSQAAQNYMQGLTERLLQGRLGFSGTYCVYYICKYAWIFSYKFYIQTLHI